MASSSVPVYFEQSWAILSSIGLVNCVFAAMIIGITSLSPLSIVPLVVSAAGAVANGLCYYAFYAKYNKTATMTAAAFADLMWLIQEAGLSFYSYLILTRVLKNRSRKVFMVLFWTVITIISCLRIAILAARVRNISESNDMLQKLIYHLHIGYFTAIAVVELISAAFLLRIFAAARRNSVEAASTSGLFSYLMRSTEIRLASLALIGITRAITYSFQETAQSATNIASQVDRFVYTMECMFPVMMFIDILASKVAVANHTNSSGASGHASYNGYSKSSSRNRRGERNTQGGDIMMYSRNHTETRVESGHAGQFSSSQEHIVKKEGASVTTVDDDLDRGNGNLGKGGGISKTVEFELRESAV